MPSEQVAVEPIQLHYTLTSEDWYDAVVAQQRGVWRRWLVVIMMVAFLIVLAKGFISSAAWELPASTIAIGAVLFLVLGLAAVGFCLLLFRLLSSWMWRLSAHLLMRGNPWLSQPIRGRLDESGLHLSSAGKESRDGWSHYPLYLETDRSFVLLASKGVGSVVLVLPKRGLVGADPAQLRALLDTYSCRRV
ncbi:MAG TPA: YcxB family protein [Micromonosporaceae bacterium]|nr:YcxB family protein [Micromonosporaceae bacterium]